MRARSFQWVGSLSLFPFPSCWLSRDAHMCFITATNQGRSPRRGPAMACRPTRWCRGSDIRPSLPTVQRRSVSLEKARIAALPKATAYTSAGRRCVLGGEDKRSPPNTVRFTTSNLNPSSSLSPVCRPPPLSPLLMGGGGGPRHYISSPWLGD